MRTVGIICEYNPLHLGHERLLRAAREQGLVICVMSGNFTQRGEAAVLPPVPRAAMALAAGADLVLELPYPFSASSARYFATAGVRALAALGCDTLAFGSESADKEALLAAGRRLCKEQEDDTAARDPKMGSAAAHFAALGATPGSNDILAMEYVRAVLSEHPDMEIWPVQREGAAYRDETLSHSLPSATALRAQLAENKDITPYIPANGVKIWQEARAAYGIADTARLGSAMLSVLRTGSYPRDIADCTGGLDAHLARAAANATDYETLCRAAATKRYTDGRIRRVLLYLLSGVTREDLLAPPCYLRLLAAGERGREYLSKTRKTRTVPVVTKQADIVALGESACRARALAAVSDALYALCLPHPVRPFALTAVPPFVP